MATETLNKLQRRIRLGRVHYCVTKLAIACLVILAATVVIEILISDHDYWYRNNHGRFRFDVGFADHGILLNGERYKGSNACFDEYLQNHALYDGWFDSGWKTIPRMRGFFNVRYFETPTFGEYRSGKHLIIPRNICTNCPQRLNASIPMVYVALPLWFIQLPVGMFLAILIYIRWHRFNPTACRKCGFDLRDNQSGICPECGTPLSKLNQTIIDASSK